MRLLSMFRPKQPQDQRPAVDTVTTTADTVTPSQPLQLTSTDPNPISIEQADLQLITIYTRSDMRPVNHGQTYSDPAGQIYRLIGSQQLPGLIGLYQLTFLKMEK